MISIVYEVSDLKKIILLVSLLWICANSAMAMSFNEAEYMGKYSCYLSGKRGLVYSAQGCTKESSSRFLFGSTDDGVFVGKGKNLSGIYAKGKIACGMFAGENSTLYRIASDLPITFYINLERSHGDLMIDVIANNGGRFVRYVNHNTVYEYLKANYGEMFAMHAYINKVTAYNNKICIDLSYNTDGAVKKGRVMLFWDEAVQWFGIEKA